MGHPGLGGGSGKKEIDFYVQDHKGLLRAGVVRDVDGLCSATVVACGDWGEGFYGAGGVGGDAGAGD
jgi:hypothetical protein